MGSPKSTLGLVAAFVPVAVFAGLAIYFMAVPGRLAATVGLPEDATKGMTAQLGPTVIGVSAIAVLCAFAFVLKLLRAGSRGPSAPGSGKGEVEEEAFDADAALARYMARKAAGGEVAVEEPQDAPVAPLGFGRKSA